VAFRRDYVVTSIDLDYLSNSWDWLLNFDSPERASHQNVIYRIASPKLGHRPSSIPPLTKQSPRQGPSWWDPPTNDALPLSRPSKKDDDAGREPHYLVLKDNVHGHDVATTAARIRIRGHRSARGGRFRRRSSRR
jgi:hypothetical protein